jgi:hypothetical protein
MATEERIPLLEEILGKWKNKLRNDYQGYNNHVYRVIYFCLALHKCNDEEREKIIIAGCFHDLGIWVNGTLDYLPPSIALVKEYLKQNNLERWTSEIELMIDMHHKIRKYQDQRYPLVEVFRRGDLVDFSLGVIKWGLPKTYIKSVKDQFPNAGFHKRLVQLGKGWFARHPLNPLPFIKW